MTEKKLTPWGRFLKLLSLERKDIYQIFYCAIFSGLVALSLPLGIQAIINLIQGAQISTSWIVLIILVTLGVIFTGALQIMQLRIIETIQQRIFVRSSFDLTYRFPKMKSEELRNHYPPELANRFFDTLSIQKGISKVLIDLPAALLQITFALLLLSFYHPLFIVFGLVLISAVYLMFQYTAKKGMETSLIESKFKYKVAHWIQEVARSNFSFKASGNTNLALEKNDALAEGYLRAREKHFGVIRLQYFKLIGFKAIITAGLLVIGGILVLNQQINIGQFVAAEIIILLVIGSVEKLISGLESLYDMLTSIEKLGQVMDKPLENQEGEELNYEQGINIELDNLTYKVPERQNPILENISLHLKPNSRILIQGEGDSGKSSLLRIIAGLINPINGNIYVNGLSIKALKLNDYRAHLGLSLSEETPFEATLKENLTFGNKSISDAKILEILKIVGLSEFLKILPKGLNSLILSEGKQLSSTVAKKITLARAILKEPKLLVLEDALDDFSESETKSIIDFLCNESNPWSLVVVSSNAYWRNYCKEIIRLKEGKIDNK